MARSVKVSIIPRHSRAAARVLRWLDGWFECPVGIHDRCANHTASQRLRWSVVHAIARRARIHTTGRLGPTAFTVRPIMSARYLWAAGVAASPLARTMGVELDRTGRVKVQTDLTILNHPEAFVIGDIAACVDASGRAMPGLAPVAIQQGRCVAATIVRALAGRLGGPVDVAVARCQAAHGANGARTSQASDPGL